MELYIVRHGETYWNAEKKFQGFADIELNENGIRLAKVTGEHLRDIDFDYVYSSPLKRAYKTANLVTEGRYDIITDDRIKEINLGEYEGKHPEEVGGEFKKFFEQPEKFYSENGETFEELRERTSEFLKEVIVPLENKANRVLLTSHAAAIKTMLSYINGTDIKDLWKGEFQKNCAVTIIELKDGIFKVKEEAKVFY